MVKSKLSATSFTFSEKEMPVRMGRYHLLSRIARDPLSEQFLAAWGVEQGIEQLRVIRCIYPRVAREAEFIGLFQEESRALSRLSSDNIVRIMEVNVQGDIPFVAREHVEGLTLDKLVDLALESKKLWPWELAAHIITELLRGLDYIHRREDIHGNPMGMRHGDVRPNNVVVSFTGEVKLINFGSMLRFIADEATHARLIRLRSPFLPPEVTDDVEPTVAADLWAAAMIFMMLSGGQLPSSHITGWVPPKLAPRVENLPDVIDTFVAKALNPDSEYRFKTAASMRSALVDIMGKHVSGHPPDDLAKWILSLGSHKKNEEQQLIRRMLGKSAEMSLENTTQAATTLGPGYVLDSRYHLLRELGEGGMGTVFEAEHVGLNKRFAVKVLHERVLTDTNTVERFKREARIIANIGHPNIVGAQDFGISERGYYFLAMDLLDGKPLSHRIWEANLTYYEIAHVMAEVCDGLEAAHLAGVIHRDLKPDNVHLTSKGPRILDFGIAKSVGLDTENDALTRTGHICGTVDYIAPEQIRGISEDPRSDIYAMGIMIYECLTGETPFHGRTIGEALHNAINDKLVTPSKRSGKKDIPAQLEGICLKALHRKAEKRYSSAKEMGEVLHELAAKLAPLDIRQNSTKDIRASFPNGMQKKVRIGILAAVALVSVAGTSYFFIDEDDSSTSSATLSENSTVDSINEKASKPISTAKSPIGHKTKKKPSIEDYPVISSSSSEEEPIKKEQLKKEPVKKGDLGAQEIGSPDEPTSSQKEAQDPEIAAMATSLKEKEVAHDQSMALAKKLTNSGNEYLRNRDYKKAKKDFNEAIRHNHRAGDAWFGLGKTTFAMGEYQKAIEKVQQSIKFSSSFKATKRRNFLGVLYKASGNKAKAEGEWRKVLASNPDNAEAKRYLGVAVD